MPFQTATVAGALMTSALLLGCGSFVSVHTAVPEACGTPHRALNQCIFNTGCTDRDRCLQTCPAEAAALLQCEGGAVASAGSAPSSCARDLDCSGELICETGRCVPQR